MHVLSFGLSTPSFLWRNVESMCELLRSIGWSGLEIFMFPGQEKVRERLEVLAPEMRISLHQPWSYAESGGLLVNRFLSLFGRLAPDQYTLASCAVGGSGRLFVAYADRCEEVVCLRNMPGQKTVFALQTATTWIGEGKARRHRMGYHDFVRAVHLHQIPVVFDTFHVLEWKLGTIGKKLCGLNESILTKALLEAWEEVGPERIVEIHWNDFTATDLLADGRACFPGEGRLGKGLTVLAKDICRRGWKGHIVPEISPLLLFPSNRKMRELKERMDSFFS